MREIRPRRAVSSRSLARRTAQVLDEIDETGDALAVVRFGRIVAVLAPFDDGEAIGLKERTAEEGIEELGLRSVDRSLFEMIAAESTRLWSPDQKPAALSITEVLASLTRLELAGLIEANLGRFRLTKRGRDVRL
jgi:antitoxin (DNA-binding transcriptional repressor) of toxin-antitoxin stability system